MAKINDLGKDKISTLVFKLAVPSMLAQMVNVLYGIVDRVYIGNIKDVGAVALAGVGVCAPIITLISSFAFLIGIGGAPLLTMRLGEKNKQGADAILANAFLMLTALSGVLTILFVAFKNPLLLMFGASEATFNYADTYFTICALGSFFALMAAGLNQFIICQGFSNVAMLTVVVGAVTNIVLDPIFIFSFKMGVAGAALATIISQAISCTFVLLFLFGKRVHVKITFYGYSFRIIKRILSFGLSPFLIIATDSIIMIVLNAVLQKYGGAEKGDMLITCATIVLSCFQLISMPLGGITGGTQPILSFNYGAKNTKRIRQAVRYILGLSLSFVSIMLIVMQSFPAFFVSIFTQDKLYFETAIYGIRVFTIGIIPMAFQYTVVDALTALGVAKVAVSLSLFRKTLFLITTILMPAIFVAQSAFFAEPVADCLAGLVSTTVFCLIIGKLLLRREQMPDGESLYA